MARERYYEEDYEPRRASNLPYFMAGTLCFIILLGCLIIVKRPDLIIGTQPERTATGAVGKQAPPNIRGSYQEPATMQSHNGALTDDAYNATSEAQYQQAVQQQSQAQETAPTPDLGPLPLNSAGQPVIDAVQQQQLNFSADMAAQDAQSEVANARATDVASRPPDVSKADAEAMMHRDLCHVPRADPHTCEQGLYKPTPVR